MAVKKKSAAKKVAKKAPTKKKSAAKKVTKKAPAKKKSAAKKVTKKAPAKKKAAKKVAKKAAKKAPARKKSSAKKSSAKKSSSSNFVVPPVPVGGVRRPSAVNVSTTPLAKAAPAAKPSAAPKQSTSPRVLIAAMIGIAVLAVIIISRPASDTSEVAPVASASATATESAAPEMSEAATPEATEPATSGEAVAAVEAPGRFIGNWKDSSKSVMVITWKAPAATAGLTGYKFEVRSGMGEWTEAGVLPADQLSIEFTKGSMDGSTSFRVSSMYSDGQMATAKAFGFAGQFE